MIPEEIRIIDQTNQGGGIRQLGILSAVFILTAILAACAAEPTATPSPTATPVPQINEVSFTSVDFGFTGPQSIPAGMTTMTMVNEGKELHHQQLLTVPDGMTAADLIAGMQAGGEGPPPPGVSAAGGVGPLGPGISGSVTMNLTAGNYVMVCVIPNAEGVPHIALGMAVPLTITEATGPLAAKPVSDLTVDMLDFSFALSAPIATGPQTIDVINKGLQDHEAFLVQLSPGATADDFIGAFAPDAPPGPPPGMGLGGFQAIAGKGEGSFKHDFAPGNYAFICFVPEATSGVPHFALGMIEEFTVQ